jgi:hypothetical protein
LAWAPQSVVFKLISKGISQAEHECMNIHPHPKLTFVSALQAIFQLSQCRHTVMSAKNKKPEEQHNKGSLGLLLEVEDKGNPLSATVDSYG